MAGRLSGIAMGNPFNRGRGALFLVVCAGLLCSCNLGAVQPGPAANPTPALPQARILSPPHNQQVIEGVIFDTEILATDTSGIQRVELYIDDQLAQTAENRSGRDSTLRVIMNWFAKGIGWHKFAAVAYREDGAASQPAIIALEVIASPAQ